MKNAANLDEWNNSDLDKRNKMMSEIYEKYALNYQRDKEIIRFYIDTLSSEYMAIDSNDLRSYVHGAVKI